MLVLKDNKLLCIRGNMEFSLDIFSFLSGALLVLIGAFVNQRIKEKADKETRLRESEYKLYLKLNSLYQWYFWFATNELHKKETDNEVYDECYKIAVSIARELNENDSSEFTEELLHLLYDETIPTYTERWKAMGALSDKMAAKLTPVHKKLSRKLNDANIELMARSDFLARAPASARFGFKV